MEIAVSVRCKNGLLWRAVQKLGSQSALARYLEVSPPVIGRWLNFKDVPAFRKAAQDGYRARVYEKWDARLIQLIGYGLEEIFPIELDQTKGSLYIAARMDRIMEMPIESLALMGVAPKQLSSPIEKLEHDHLLHMVDSALEELTPREEKVVKMRFGIGEHNEQTYDEIGKHFGVSRERIRQIENKALRKLRRTVKA